MIRVLGATGRLFEVSAVVPIVETVIAFNGKMEHRLEVAKNMDANPNGLLFLNDLENIGAGYWAVLNGMEYIGNISTNEVREILACLLTEGFYNFSEWDYQMEEELRKIVLDNGNGRPYSSAITNSWLPNDIAKLEIFKARHMPDESDPEPEHQKGKRGKKKFCADCDIDFPEDEEEEDEEDRAWSAWSDWGLEE